MYSLSGYGKMIADRLRIEAYVRALEGAVTRDSVVLDLGAGTGFFALLACQLGARKVYAIEPSPAIEIAREMARDNGYRDRIEFIQALSTTVNIEERADVILSDLRGILPLFGQHIPTILDARSRLLAPDGILIPKRDRLWATLVTAPELYRQHLSPWEDEPYNLNLRAGRRFMVNTWRQTLFRVEQCLVEPQCWLTLDYATIENPNASAELSWTVERPGEACGLGLWFDTTLADGVTFSNAPGQPELIYKQAFVPWLHPVELAQRDRVVVKLQANLVKDDYIWRWQTRVFRAGDDTDLKAEFKQSTFLSQPISRSQLP